MLALCSPWNHTTQEYLACLIAVSQEFALGRALNQRHRGQRRGSAAPAAPAAAAAAASRPSAPPAFSASTSASSGVAPSSGDTPEDLANFVTAFKEMASQLDEDGARNLLMWSPLFVPTVQGLMRPGARPRRAKPRLKASNPPELVHPAPSAADVATAAARDAHMAQLQRMYAAGGAGDADTSRRAAMAGCATTAAEVRKDPTLTDAPGGVAIAQAADSDASKCATPGIRSACGVPSGTRSTPEADMAPLVPRAANCGCFALSPGAALPPGSPWDTCSPAAARPASGGRPLAAAELEDQWEEEVDSLLQWTTELPGIPD